MVFPELVTTWGDEGYKALEYGRFSAVLLEAVKELKANVEALAHRVASLESFRGKHQRKQSRRSASFRVEKLCQ